MSKFSSHTFNTLTNVSSPRQVIPQERRGGLVGTTHRCQTWELLPSDFFRLANVINATRTISYNNGMSADEVDVEGVATDTPNFHKFCDSHNFFL